MVLSVVALVVALIALAASLIPVILLARLARDIVRETPKPAATTGNINIADAGLVDQIAQRRQQRLAGRP